MTITKSSVAVPDHIRDLFPIHFEPFEDYLIRDESPSFPMTWCFEWRFEGQVRRAEFELAFWEMLINEPLFWAKAEKRKGRFCWVESPHPPTMAWNDKRGEAFPDHQPQSTGIIPVDIHGGPVLRVEVDQYDQQLVLRAFAHHAATDGMGMTFFMANWLSRYANLIGDVDGVRPFSPAPSRIADRGKLNIVLPEKISFFTILRSFAKETAGWLMRRPFNLEKTVPRSPRERKQGESAGTNDVPIQLWRPLSRDFLAAYRQKAQTWGVSMNSLFVSDLFCFLKQRNQKLAIKHFTRKYLRVLIPVNLRNDFHHDIPASNILGYVFLDRLPAGCSGEKEFAEQVDREMKFIRKWSVGAMFLDGVRFFRRIPFALSYLASPRFCHSTIVFSNLGNCCSALPQERFRKEKTVRVDGLVLKHVIGSPPVRPHTPFTFGLIACGRETALIMTTRRSCYENKEAERFMNGFITFLERDVLQT